MTPLLDNLLLLCEDLAASDIHLCVGQRPRFRIRGALVEKGDFPPLDAAAVDALAAEIGLFSLPVDVTDGEARIRATLLRNGSIDGALTHATGARYRFNLFREAARTAIALRLLDSKFRSFAELGVPARLEDFCDEPDGLVIITGPTGSGKSTTLATMIDKINHQRSGHIITIEDPIEYIHTSAHCLVNQRQVGRDTQGFGEALVEALRQDPDVILVGETRDLNTVRTALRAAETGHLVFTTLHSGDCAGAIERLISLFPADEQPSARRQLALVLRGICAQHLLPSADRTTRHPACELLVNTSAVGNLIVSGRSSQIYSSIETGGALGMQTLDSALAALITARRITPQVGLTLSKNPDMLRTRLGLTN